MSRQIQIRRGTSAENDAFTGAIGEITMDTTNKTLRVHDGTTAGGTKLAKLSEIPEQYVMPSNYDFVVEVQNPTSANNYTWYRKYKSGWVEMGGTSSISFSSNGSNTTVSLPVTMSDTHYTINATLFNKYGNKFLGTATPTTTSFYICGYSSNTDSGTCFWEVKGFAA